ERASRLSRRHHRRIDSLLVLMSKDPVTDEDAQSSNLTNRIFVELRRQILKGELLPGERLPGERELAQKYDTNRNTLREAVRRLEQLHLVTVRHGQGVTVADFKNREPWSYWRPSSSRAQNS
ncbi:MAG: winged helix-turn-helix domain-containing protein, partial [Polyangiaceae bacterium]